MPARQLVMIRNAQKHSESAPTARTEDRLRGPCLQVLESCTVKGGSIELSFDQEKMKDDVIQVRDTDVIGQCADFIVIMSSC